MPETHSLTVEGLRIAFTASSDPYSGRTPVVFVHGSGGSAHTWHHQLQADLPGCVQIAPDLPGHARSNGSGADSVDAYCAFIRAFADAAGFARLILAGHSLGGAITQAFALAHPDRLLGLGLIGTGARLRVAPDVIARVRAGESFAAWSFAAATDPAVVEAAERDAALTPPAVRAKDFLACDRFDIMDSVSAISLPTLILCGAADRLTPVKYARFLESRIAGSVLRIVPEAGHMVMWEQPAAVNAALAAFCAPLAAAAAR